MLELEENPPPAIFTTAFDTYAIKAFEANAVDYLLKPFTRDRFEKAVQKFLTGRGEGAKQAEAAKKVAEALPAAAQNAERVVVKSGSKIIIIPGNQIEYIEADDDYVKIHSAQGMFTKSRTLYYFENLLNPDQFVRVHRSYLLNVAYIQRMEPYQKDAYFAVLSTGAKVPVSQAGYAKLKGVLGL